MADPRNHCLINSPIPPNAKHDPDRGPTLRIQKHSRGKSKIPTGSPRKIVPSSCGCASTGPTPKHPTASGNPRFLVEQFPVKFSGAFCFVVGNDGRPVGTRTPDLYRVKVATLGFTITYKTAGTAKIRGSRTKQHSLWVEVWVEYESSKPRDSSVRSQDESTHLFSAALKVLFDFFAAQVYSLPPAITFLVLPASIGFVCPLLSFSESSQPKREIIGSNVEVRSSEGIIGGTEEGNNRNPP